MNHAALHGHKSTIGRAKIVPRTFGLLSDATRRQEGDAMRYSPTTKSPSMPMLRRLIRRWVDLGFDLGGLIIDEHDILNDLGAGRE